MAPPAICPHSGLGRDADLPMPSHPVGENNRCDFTEPQMRNRQVASACRTSASSESVKLADLDCPHVSPGFEKMGCKAVSQCDFLNRKSSSMRRRSGVIESLCSQPSRLNESTGRKLPGRKSEDSLESTQWDGRLLTQPSCDVILRVKVSRPQVSDARDSEAFAQCSLEVG